MATVRTFEELQVWKTARQLSQTVYDFTKYESFAKDYRFKDQIRASSGSVMDNIAEGFERGSRKEFIQFLTVAKGSAGEARSQLYRALDQNYISPTEFESAYGLCVSLARMLYAFIEHLKETDTPGIRYKVEEPITAYSSASEDMFTLASNPQTQSNLQTNLFS